MTQPSDVQAVLAKYGLTAPADDLQGAIKELRARLAGLHPDKFGADGKFPSERHQASYLELSNDVDFLQSAAADKRTQTVPDSRALIADTIAATVKALQSADVFPFGPSPALQHQATDSWLGRRYNSQIVTAAVALSVCTALCAFLLTAEDTPLLRPLFAWHWARPIALGIWAVSGLVALTAWLHKRRAMVLAEYLLSEEGLHEIFEGLRSECGSEGVFSLATLTQAVLTHPHNGLSHRYPLWYWRTAYRPSRGAKAMRALSTLAENLLGYPLLSATEARLIAREQARYLLERRVVVLDPDPSVLPLYRFAPQMVSPRVQ